MARAAFFRREYSPRWLATAIFHAISEISQVGKHFAKAERDMSLDVLKKAVSRSNNPNCSPDPRPQVARIFFAFPLASRAEPLAGIGSDKKVDAISEWFAWETLAIRPDRKRVQESRFHFRNHIGNSVGFDLTSSDAAQIWDNSPESDMISAVAKEPLDCSDRGIIHTQDPLALRNYLLHREGCS
jgi:hypothetical protein